jgi:hypothetical protein
MLNPYYVLLKETKTTQADFGKKYGFSPTTMTYIMSGQYTSLSNRMITSLGQEVGEKGVDAFQILRDRYTETTLQKAYSRWQRVDRYANGKHLPPPEKSTRPDKSPFSKLVRKVGSTQSFAKMFHIPSVTISRYARGETRTMPGVIYGALVDAGYRDIMRLREYQEEWLA